MKRETHLPLSEAFQISLEQIWKRQARSIIVVASITLGILYLTYFLATNAIFGASLKDGSASVEAYQFWLVVVSIFVCGISVVNSTLIAVLERYGEIGTMKCLGALDKHILEFFLIEAFLFGLVGGVTGFTLGVIISILSSCLQLGFDILQRLPLTDFLKLFGPIIASSVTLSVISTAYPALRAAKLNPVEALRYDA